MSKSVDYQGFLESKRAPETCSGIDPNDPHDILYGFQSAIVKWAVKRGRAAVFADCGLGKTLIQIEWLRQVGKRSLIVAPLGVTRQTIKEGEKVGCNIEYTTADPPKGDGIWITNYERLRNFTASEYDSIVLDESSILKSIDGKTRTLILDSFSGIPFRLCCTATPAPNDLTELGNHAEFLGIMTNREMSASYFVKESNSMHWRLKGHASAAFYEWLASWAVYIRKPSDIGYPDDKFNLPPLNVESVEVLTDYRAPGKLFPGVEAGIQGRIHARRTTEDQRIARAVEIINGDDEQWIIWCGLNSEGRKLYKAIKDDAVLVEGTTPEDQKLKASDKWISGESRVMITKPKIYGFGMNFQHCHNVLFLGLGDSYEQYYQAIRRCWRFGQECPVNVQIVISDAEGQVVANVKRKESQSHAMAVEVVKNMKDIETRNVQGAARDIVAHETDESEGELWRMMMGDSVDRLAEIEPDSIGLSVFSPPFVSLYTYTATERDIGNSKNENIFFDHYRYIVDGLLRATMPGRNCCVHVSQVPAMLARDGYIGIKDFRARVVQEHQSRGWIYHGEVVIDKDPQAQAIRTHSKGLLFVQKDKDASWLRPALADYILVFRKPGDNAVPIKSDLSNEEWIEWARPIWYGIRESETLNYREARADKDERHICPLQLGTIERCVRLWSAVGDTVLSPFAGIGSEGYVSVRHKRRFIGIELKREYYDLAVKNLSAAERETLPLFEEHQG